MINVFTEVTINKPVDLIADYAANPNKAPEWYVNKPSSDGLISSPARYCFRGFP